MRSKSAHLSDNRGLYGGAPSGNKRTTNQNAPFQISTNQNELQICLFLSLQKDIHTTQVVAHPVDMTKPCPPSLFQEEADVLLFCCFLESGVGDDLGPVHFQYLP